MADSPPATQFDETVTGVTSRIREWVALGVPGIVWIRYVSDTSRDMVLDRLSTDRPIERIRFHPPDPAAGAEWLEEQLKAVPELSVVAVLFSPLLGAGVDALPAAFRSLNLRREAITRLPVTQLWWIPASVAPRAEAEGPDLASWYQVRMTLREIVSELESESPPSMRHISAESLSPAAIQGLEDAVERQRRLVSSDADSYLPQLASALNSLANGYRETQRVEEAEASYSESLAIYRRLAEDNPDIYLPGLASSLGDLATMRSDLGRHEEALPLAEESVRIYRQVAEQRPDAFLPGLASSLNNLANILSELGRHEEALVVGGGIRPHLPPTCAATSRCFPP